MTSAFLVFRCFTFHLGWNAITSPGPREHCWHTGCDGARMPGDFDNAAYVDAAAALIELPLDPAHRPGVILNLQRIAAMAALFMDFPLPEETEPAPVYEP
jgi:hypothetical protein